MKPILLAACLALPLAGAALAQGTAISPAQSVANQPGAAPPAAAPAPGSRMAGTAEAPAKRTRTKTKKRTRAR